MRPSTAPSRASSRRPVVFTISLKPEAPRIIATGEVVPISKNHRRFAAVMTEVPARPDYWEARAMIEVFPDGRKNRLAGLPGDLVGTFGPGLERAAIEAVKALTAKHGQDFKARAYYPDEQGVLRYLTGSGKPHRAAEWLKRPV